ncbi:MAG: hypothetical protein IT374_13770 [Polyangiaceae bacterium]|nr:hypothetical protein [Polyangiaceae bacterium]
MTRRGGVSAAALLLGLAACDRLQASTDRALARLSGRADGGCPDAVEGRAAGAESAEAALACFQRAVAERSATLLLRVTCRGRAPSSCKQTDATEKEAERLVADLATHPWDAQLGSWQDAQKATVFAIDTSPGQKTVSTLTVCKIVEGDRWAVCETGELSRAEAEKRASKAQ